MSRRRLGPLAMTSVDQMERWFESIKLHHPDRDLGIAFSQLARDAADSSESLFILEDNGYQANETALLRTRLDYLLQGFDNSDVITDLAEIHGRIIDLTFRWYDDLERELGLEPDSPASEPVQINWKKYGF